MSNPLPYLDALGITPWQRRDKPLSSAATHLEEPAPVVAAEAPSTTATALPTSVSHPQNETPVSTLVAPPLKTHFQEEMPALDAPPDYLNIPDTAFDDRFEPLLPEDDEPYVPEPMLDPKQVRAQNIQQLDWAGLQKTVEDCRDCALHTHRTQTVFGVGAVPARWLIVGEAPGHDEDLQGEPFVGRAGQLLNAMLQAVGVKREQVYIANTVKCRPPQNRNPEALEMETCAPYLQRQIALIQPQLIVLIGRVAVQQILHSEEAIGRLRGTLHQHAETGTPVIVSYHPAYLLRRPTEKAKTWLDLQLAYRTVTPLK